MKNKGFTLVELLAVIIVMSVIAAIVVTSAYSIVKSNRDEQYDVLITEIKQAVRLYLNDNYENYVVGREFNHLPVRVLNDNDCSKIYIKLKDLVDANLLKESNLIDPTNNKNINIEKYIEVYYENSDLTISRDFIDTPKNYCDNTNIIYDSNSKSYYMNTDNNYVSLNNQLWRIIGINKDGSIKLLLNDNIGNSVFGQNGSYTSSYVLTSMQYWYMYDVSESSKDLIKESSLSLLMNTEYSSLPNNIKGTDEFWLIDSNDNTGITTNGNKDYNKYSSLIKPTIELKSNVIYVSGNGNISNPYTIR